MGNRGMRQAEKGVEGRRMRDEWALHSTRNGALSANLVQVIVAAASTKASCAPLLPCMPCFMKLKFRG